VSILTAISTRAGRALDAMAIGSISACVFDFDMFRIFEASTKGYSINYIIAPSTVYGVGTENPVHKLSVQIPHLIRLAIERKQAVYGGEGMFCTGYLVMYFFCHSERRPV